MTEMTYAERKALMDSAVDNIAAANITTHPDAFLAGIVSMILTDEQVRYIFQRSIEIMKGE